MTRPRHLHALLLASPLLAGPALAWAQPVPPSPEQARALERQIHDTISAATEGMLKLPARPIELTAEGDHYQVRIPLGPLVRIEPADAAITAEARPLEGTLWSVTHQQYPSDIKVTTDVLVPNLPTAKNPHPTGGHQETVTYAIKLGAQDAHGTFDTSFAAPTSSTGTIAGVDILRTDADAARLTHIDKVTTQTSTRPLDPGRTDILSDTTAEGYATQVSMPDGSVFTMTAQSLHVASGVNGLMHEKLLPLLHQAIAASKLKPDATDAKTKAATSAALRQMLVLAKDLLTGMRIDESASMVKFGVAGYSGSFTQANVAFGGDAPQDMLSASLTFLLDGLVVNELAPAFAAYVPTHLSIRPTLANLSVADLTRIGTTAAANPDKAVPPQAWEALFKHGGISVGFEDLGLDIAGAQVAGNGKFVVTGPQMVTGQAEITAHGLDALIAQAQGDPLLAQGVPVIIFLKGIARTNGDQAVWQVAVQNQKVLVNGVDLSALTGGMK